MARADPPAPEMTAAWIAGAGVDAIEDGEGGSDLGPEMVGPGLPAAGIVGTGVADADMMAGDGVCGSDL